MTKHEISIRAPRFSQGFGHGYVTADTIDVTIDGYPVDKVTYNSALSMIAEAINSGNCGGDTVHEILDSVGDDMARERDRCSVTVLYEKYPVWTVSGDCAAGVLNGDCDFLVLYEADCNMYHVVDLSDDGRYDAHTQSYHVMGCELQFWRHITPTWYIGSHMQYSTAYIAENVDDGTFTACDGDEAREVLAAYLRVDPWQGFDYWPANDAAAAIA